MVPLFVGSSAGSRDTRLLLKALVRMLLAAVSPEAARAKDAVPEALEQLQDRVPELLRKLAAAGTPAIILLDGISEVFDLYTPPALDWLPALLSEAVVVMTLVTRGEVEAIRRGAAVDMAVELSTLSGEERTALLTHLVLWICIDR